MNAEIEEFEFTKRMAFFISYIREELRGKKKKRLSDKDITLLLNSQDAPNHVADGGRVNQIKNATWTIPPSEQSKWRSAGDAIIRKNKLPIDLREEIPSWLVDRYSHDLPPAYRQPSAIQQGEALGEMANTLHGLWHFFYLSPIDRQGEIAPEIRGTAAIFEKASAESHSIRLQLLSGHGVWKGTAFVNDSHLYLSCTVAQKIETAFFVTNRPDKRSFTIAGTGAALERHKEHGKVPATAGFICFGVKWSAKNNYFKTHPSHDPVWIEKTLNEFDSGIKFSEEAENKLRDIFCVKVTLKDIEERYPDLHKHVSGLKINGKPGLATETWIYVDSE